MSTLLTEFQDAALTIRLNRPERANAFNLEMLYELLEVLKAAATDSQIRCIILTGKGSSFCTGHDITEMLTVQRQDISYKDHLRQTYNPIILQIRQMEKPVVAAINGPIAGAGLGVTLACDLRIAVDTATITVGFTRIGLVPDSAVSLLLPVLIGLGRATEFTFTNQPINAAQALEWGLFNQVVPANMLIDTATNLSNSLAAGPTGAYGLTKRLFNRSTLPNLENILEFEGELQDLASKNDEHIAGVNSFMENQK